MTRSKILEKSVQLVCVALISSHLGLAAAAQEPPSDRTVVVLRGDAGVKIQEGQFQFDLGERGEIAEVAVKPSQRGFLGFQVQDLTPELRVHFGAPEDSGVIVSRVEPGGPAETADVRTGDVLTAVNGEPMTTALEFQRLERSFEDAEVVALTLVRDGKYQQTAAVATLQERLEIDVRSLVRSSGPGEANVFEIETGALTGELRRVADHLGSNTWQEQYQDVRRIYERMQDGLRALKVEIKLQEDAIGDRAPR